LLRVLDDVNLPLDNTRSERVLRKIDSLVKTPGTVEARSAGA
jgi:hypothetical protein